MLYCKERSEVKMIFVFIEDGTLDVIDSEEEALREYEGVDVENRVFEFYSEDGVYLIPQFTIPNEYSSLFFGFFQSVVSGVFTLVPDPNANEDSFEAMLCETTFLNENKFFNSLDEVKGKFNVAT